MTNVRFSVAGVMVAIGIIALNLAAARFLWDYDAELVLWFLPVGLALQFGAFRLIRSRGRRRAFWVGFVIAGALGPLSLAWGMLFSGSIGIGRDSVTGQTVRVSTPGSFGGDQVLGLWSYYSDVAERCLDRLPSAWKFLPNFPPVMAVIIFLPQLFMAVAGGLLTLCGVWFSGPGRESNTSEFIAQLKETGRPVVLTIDGEAELIVQDLASYQRLIELAEKAERVGSLRTSIQEMKAGKVVPAEDVLADMQRILAERHRQ